MPFTSLSFQVSNALPPAVTQGRQLAIAAWLFVPEPSLLGARPRVISMLNGGTYDKRYFHFEVPGRTGYSAAEHLCRLGNIVVLTDHLGIGESARAPDQKNVTREVAAAANHAALQQIYAQLEQGTLHTDLPPLQNYAKIGVGHSLGGMQTITQQARHRTFDAIGILGYTAYGVQFSVDGKLVSADPGPITDADPDYLMADRKFLKEGFHWDDVPATVIAVDDNLLVEVPGVLAKQSISTGIVTADAAEIDVPIYICLGERDVSPDPRAEPTYYQRSRDITLHILPRSGHCQNFASTRHIMFDRIDSWSRTFASC